MGQRRSIEAPRDTTPRGGVDRSRRPPRSPRGCCGRPGAKTRVARSKALRWRPRPASARGRGGRSGHGGRRLTTLEDGSDTWAEAEEQLAAFHTYLDGAEATSRLERRRLAAWEKIAPRLLRKAATLRPARRGRGQGQTSEAAAAKAHKAAEDARATAEGADAREKINATLLTKARRARSRVETRARYAAAIADGGDAWTDLGEDGRERLEPCEPRPRRGRRAVRHGRPDGDLYARPDESRWDPRHPGTGPTTRPSGGRPSTGGSAPSGWRRRSSGSRAAPAASSSSRCGARRAAHRGPGRQADRGPVPPHRGDLTHPGVQLKRAQAQYAGFVLQAVDGEIYLTHPNDMQAPSEDASGALRTNWNEEALRTFRRYVAAAEEKAEAAVTERRSAAGAPTHKRQGRPPRREEASSGQGRRGHRVRATATRSTSGKWKGSRTSSPTPRSPKDGGVKRHVTAATKKHTRARTFALARPSKTLQKISKGSMSWTCSVATSLISSLLGRCIWICSITLGSVRPATTKGFA